MTISPSWYGNAVIYQVDPRLFYDADGDGWGDLPGVIERLPYLRGLGTTAVWLLPFYVSPFRDGGYDVVDHLAVDPRLGDLADVARLLETADDMGIHVIVELVCQHTSDQHRWFQDARSSRTSRYRDYYVWSDEPVKTGVEPMFPEVEDDVWTWDSEAQQFYRHTFYSFEPDLALDNPRVRDELERIMTFWLRLGVSGFRVDAVPYMVERARQADPAEDGQWLVRQMRDVVTRQNAGAVLLGEADVEPLLWALDQQPDPPRHGQYAQWLRNNDELDLERLSDAERAEVLEAFAPQRRMQVYGRGIRRRLAPMLDGDARRIALAHAVLFSLPGPPILRYGDEIGMGDDLARSEREAVRTPMQWTDGRNAGFSQADPDDLVAPVISRGPYAYTRVNVADQAVHGGSLHNRVGALIRARLGLPETGLVRPEPVEVTGADGRPATSVLALRYAHGSSCVVMLANLADADVEVRSTPTRRSTPRSSTSSPTRRTTARSPCAGAAGRCARASGSPGTATAGCARATAPSTTPRDDGHDTTTPTTPAHQEVPMTVEPMPTPMLERRAEQLEDDDALDRLVERLQRVAASVVPEGRLRQELRGRSLGHALHPVLTDLPLGCWTAATVLDLVGPEKHADAARTLVGAGVLAVVPTALSGLADWVGLRSTASRRVGAAHAALNGVAGTLFATSWLLRRRGSTSAGIAASMLGVGVVTVSGYLGGHLAIGRAEPSASATDVV